MITAPPESPRVHPRLDKIAAYSWRLIVIGVVALAGLWLLRQARVVFIPVVIALFMTRALSPVAGWLRRRRFRPGLAAAASMLLFFVVLGALLVVVVRSFAGEAESIGPTLTEAVDDVETWLVDDSPFELTRQDVRDVRERVGEEVRDLRRSSDGQIADQATLVAEVATGMILAVILTFFMLRDGRRLTAWLAKRAGPGRQARMSRAMNSAWSTLSGYLRGATLLGAVESVLIGLTLFITGGSLVAPVMVITFLGAYIPLVGAVVAGVVAVLVALVTGGTGAAIAVAVVALIIQQLDNDLLAPIIYGRALSLHPAVILLSVVAGGALFGFAGTVLAVPTVAVAFNALREYNRSDPDPNGSAETGHDLSGI